MNLLDLAVKITCDDQASKEVDGIGSKIKGGLVAAAKVGATAIAAIGTATIAVGKTALDAYSNYEQLVGGVDKLYGSASQKLQDYAAQAYQTAGMSANQYMEQATSFSAALISSLNGDVDKAADLTDVAMRAMSDNVNVFGSNMQDVQNAFQGFAKQNYTMLDNLKLGYGGTQSEMQRLIKDASQMTDVQAQLGLTVDSSSLSFDNIVKAIQVMQTSMGIAGTTSREAAQTIEGSVNTMKASWENWLAGLGNENADMGALTDQLVQSVITAGNNVIPRFGQIMETLITTITQYAPQVGQTIVDGLSQIDFTQVGTTASNLLLMLVDGIVQNLPMLATAALQIVLAIGQGLVTNGPQILTSLGLLLTQFAEYIIANVPNILNAAVQLFSMILQGLSDNAPTIITTLLTLLDQLITQVATWAGQMLTQAVQAGSQFLSGLIGQLSQVPGRVANYLSHVINSVINWARAMASSATQAASQFGQNLVSGLASIPGKMVEIGGQIVQGLVDGVTGAASSLVESVKGVVSSAIDGAKNLLGIHSPSRVFRAIGQYSMQGLALGVDDDADLVTQSTDDVVRDMVKTAQPVTGNTLSSTSASQSDVIEWLARNLPGIISQYTPVIGQKEFGRMARKAVAYA